MEVFTFQQYPTFLVIRKQFFCWISRSWWEKKNFQAQQPFFVSFNIVFRLRKNWICSFFCFVRSREKLLNFVCLIQLFVFSFLLEGNAYQKQTNRLQIVFLTNLNDFHHIAHSLLLQESNTPERKLKKKSWFLTSCSLVLFPKRKNSTVRETFFHFFFSFFSQCRLRKRKKKKTKKIAEWVAFFLTVCLWSYYMKACEEEYFIWNKKKTWLLWKISKTCVLKIFEIVWKVTSSILYTASSELW